MLLLNLSFISATATKVASGTTLKSFVESSLTGNIIGFISLIVTSISLYVSWIGYMQSQEAAKKADKASEQAAEASQNAAEASEKLDKIRRYEVLGAEIKNELSKAKELQKDLDKAQVYLAILTRLKENDYFQPGVKNNLEKAINSLNKRLGYMIHEIFYEIDANKEALANAEGLIDVCIDKLQGKG